MHSGKIECNIEEKTPIRVVCLIQFRYSLNEQAQKQQQGFKFQLKHEVISMKLNVDLHLRLRKRKKHISRTNVLYTIKI